MKQVRWMIMALLMALPGCVRYDYHSPDGCGLTIWSMREIQAGKIRISKNCALTGGADSMTYNEQQMQIMGNLVNKIP